MEFTAILKILIGLVTGKAGAAAIAAAIGLGLGLAVKKVPNLLGGLMAKELTKGFDKMGEIQDPVLRQLVENAALDIVKIAEYMIPDAGQGRARYEKAAQWLCAMFPPLQGNDKALADLIEKAVVKMDEALKIKVVK